MREMRSEILVSREEIWEGEVRDTGTRANKRRDEMRREEEMWRYEELK